MADLSFVRVVGRFGLVVADGPGDLDENPDTVWCDEGEVWFTPLNTYTKVADASPVPAMLGQSVIKVPIDDQGYLALSGVRSVYLVDLTSPVLNPYIPEGKATHRVEFRNIKASGTPINFESFNARFAADTVGQNGSVDLTLAAPVPSAGGTPIVVGPQGVSVRGLSVDGNELTYVLSDGTEESAGILPLMKGDKGDLAGSLKEDTNTPGFYVPYDVVANGTSIDDHGVAQQVKMGPETKAQFDSTTAALVNSKVPPLVVQLLATDATVSGAAAAAVNTKLNEAGILHDAVNIDLPNAPAVFVVTDSEDRRSWLEVAADGGPTARVAAIIKAIAKTAGLDAGSVTAAMLDPATVLLPLVVSALDRSFVITDSDDRVAFGIDDSGALIFSKVTPETAAKLVTSLTAAGFSPIPSTYKSTYQATTRKLVSGPDVVLVGHSMLAQAAAAITAALPAVTVSNLAIGGEQSVSIAARQGGQPATFLLSGGTLPASGPVALTFSYAGGVISSWPMLQGPASYTGYITLNDGTKIPGTFSVTRDPAATAYVHHAGDVYYFTRTTAGSALTVDRPVPFYYDVAEAQRESIAVYWAGRNNITATDQVVGDIQAMIQHQAPLRARFVVLSDHNQATEPSGSPTYISMTALNDRYRYLYGRRFIDTRSYLINYGLADAGITPTTQDTTDISNGVVPSSLRATGDNLHLNSAGSTVVASLVKRRLTELGWY